MPCQFALSSRLSPCSSAEGFLLAWQSTAGHTWGVLYFGYCIFQGYNLHLILKKKNHDDVYFFVEMYHLFKEDVQLFIRQLPA